MQSLIRKYTLLTITLLMYFNLLTSQTVEQIKADRNNYYWGEGVGTNTGQADKDALSMLIGNISVKIESEFKMLREEESGKNKKIVNQLVKEVISTYSKATLKNTEILTWGKEPEIYVFRYIKKEEISKIFKERELKINEFINTALKAEKRLQVADALKHYYWALMLTRSHPNGDTIKVMHEGNRRFVTSFINEKMNYIFDNLSFNILEKKVVDNITTCILNIQFNGNNVTNLEYSFFDGRFWSNIMAAKDGIGTVELTGDISNIEFLRLKVEYIFEGEWKVDQEVYDLLHALEGINFKKSEYAIPFVEPKSNTINEEKVSEATFRTQEKTENSSSFYLEDTAPYYELMQKVTDGITKKDLNNLRALFTESGFEIFKKLVIYGDASIIVLDPKFSFLSYQGSVFARSLPMLFKFRNNRREFVKNILFEISEKDKLITSLSFSLSENVIREMMVKEEWQDDSKISIINFLENYQTAYALKRLDYLQAVFSDNALIIVGKVLKPTYGGDSDRYQLPQAIRTTYSKKQYLDRLSVVFNSNEFINIKFTNSEVVKAGDGGEIYGIQIKQDYFSSNYGDTGYLFLMVDLNKPANPIIHVRTWQQERDPDYGLIDLSLF